MAFRLMIIDDLPAERESIYRSLFVRERGFEPIFVWSPKDLDREKDTPVDGYILDIVLDKGDWPNRTALDLLWKELKDLPRPAPIFFVSQSWGEPEVMGVLNEISLSGAVEISQYLAWTEFQDAYRSAAEAPDQVLPLLQKIGTEISRWHGFSELTLGPDEELRVLLLADIQYGDPGADPKAELFEHWIVQQLGRASKPHIVAIAGDIGYSGSPHEYELARESLEKDLLGRFWGTDLARFRDRILLVPGNHDLNFRFVAADEFDWSVGEGKWVKADTKARIEQAVGDCESSPSLSWRKQHRDFSFDPFRRFANSISPHGYWDHIPSLSWVDRRFRDLGVRFILVNTACQASVALPKTARFGSKTVKTILRSLGDETVQDDIFNVVISHHGVMPAGKSGEEIDDWEAVAEPFMHACQSHVWVFGHNHKFANWLHTSEPFDNDRPLNVVMLPTGRMIPSGEPRGFCLLRLGRRSGVVTRADLEYFSSRGDKRSIQLTIGKAGAK